MRGFRGARKTPEQELEETREELASAKEKQARWTARVAELQDSVTAQENALILGAVRSVAASPEELRGLLDRIRGGGLIPAVAESVTREPPAVAETAREPFAVAETPSAPCEIQADTEEPPLSEEDLLDEE